MQSTLPYNMKAALRAQRSMRYQAPTDNKASNTPKAQWYVIKGTHTQSICFIIRVITEAADFKALAEGICPLHAGT
jgi:hypothetical protein